MKIFVTGHRGYIGSLLVSQLQTQGHFVTGCDLCLYKNSEYSLIVKPNKEYVRDIRSLTPQHLEGHDGIMHLAALSNDPMGAINPKLTESINRDAAVHLARIAKQARVPRYLFSSSCSIYGQNIEGMDLNETAPLHPQSVYARTKIEAEKEIALLADSNFSPVFLRNSTAYGDSPMLRLDLMVNNLMACAFTTGEIHILSDGSPWRPLVHVKDIARAFIAFLQAPREKIHNQAINIGRNEENYQVRQVASRISKIFPKARITYSPKANIDSRNYRVNFDLLSTILPDFQFEYSLDLALNELHRSFVEHKLSLQDFRDGKFERIVSLKNQLDTLKSG